MKDFFRNIGAAIQRWMSGRYGYDELSRAMNIAALVGLILSCIPYLQVLYIPTLVLLVWSMVRAYSRNIEKRRLERAAYLRFTGRIKSWWNVRKKAWKERKTHRYYRCKNCKTMLRVPKGKGKIQIRCPKCHSEIIRKT